MKRLIVVRHGNTFRSGETPLRVGCRTDLPLVEGERAARAGRFLRENGWIPDRVVAAPLKRTVETAEGILDALRIRMPIEKTDVFSEIDYGVDEARTEDEVMDRLGRVYLEREGRLDGASPETIRARGKQAIDDWNSKAVPPDGWNVDPEILVRNWTDFAEGIRDGETVLVVSSNGIIRFAPHILKKDVYERFVAENNLKVATGGICLFEYENDAWNILDWNVKPRDI